ncbi:MAG TPA: BatA domain-containing protein, partial [Gemmatimonadales bacterium]|nr:BatA domain-containing protein [Gemmatimonadales bacterium]
MIFLHPLALLGLAAAAIPALLHLLHRRDPPELDFPPLRYLTEAERRSARRLKLRHLLLLVLRTALIVTVVLAAARPLVPAPGGPARGHEPTAVVVVLDNSPSAGAVLGGRPVFERLRGAAAAAVSEATPADRVRLLLADGVMRTASRAALLEVLDSVTVGHQRLELSRAVERAARVVNAEPLPAREVQVLSDLQRTALGDLPAEVPPGVRVLALAPLPTAIANRGLAEARVRDGAVRVSVAGTPRTPAGAVSVRVGRGPGAGGGLRPAGRALVAPGQGAAISLPGLSPGWWMGEAELEPDELRADDRR